MVVQTEANSMSRFTSAQRAGILAEARANLAKRTNLAEREATSSRQSEIIYKTNHDAAVGSSPARSTSAGAELPWWQWVDERLESCLEANNEGVGVALAEYCAQEIAPLKRELELLQREVTQLREQVGLERGLRDLRTQVEVARAQVPKIPEIAARLEREQGRLQRELESTQQKLKRTRVDQRIADYQLNKLREATEARSAAVEMKLETSISSFTMRDIHPDAASALKNFAAETFKKETLWVFPAGSA
jgi:hypothetical protein